MFVERTMQVKDPLDYDSADWTALMQAYSAKHNIPLEALEAAANELSDSEKPN